MATLTKTPYTAGSGNCRRTNNETWADARSGTTANAVDSSGGVELMAAAQPGVATNWLYRGFAQFDISSIPKNSTINSAVITITFSVQEDGDSGALCVEESTQPSSTALAVAHYNDLAALNSPTQFAPQIVFSGASNPETFTFNQNGLNRIEEIVNDGDTWLKLAFRERKDLENDSSTGANKVNCNLDTISLTVTYTPPSGGSFLYNFV